MSRTVVKPASRSNLRVGERDQRALGGRVGSVEVRWTCPSIIPGSTSPGRGLSASRRGDLYARADLRDALRRGTTITGLASILPDLASNILGGADRDDLVRRREVFPRLRRRGGVCHLLPFLSPSCDHRGVLAPAAMTATNTTLSLF